MKILVLVKQVPDTYGDRRLETPSGTLDRDASDRVFDEIDERALEVALRRKDAERDTEVVVMSMGPSEATDVLRKALAMGADSAVHVLDDGLRGADTVHTARALAAALSRTGFDLVIAGNESTDGRSGVVPAMIAETLGVPLLGALADVAVHPDRVQGSRQTERAVVEVHSALPAVVSITEQAPEARFPGFKGILGAKRKKIAVLTLADLGVASTGPARSVIRSAAASPGRTAGTKIVDDGTAAEQLARFLVANDLV
jgi:electron transfer flavoprotein beta subunit